MNNILRSAIGAVVIATLPLSITLAAGDVLTTQMRQTAKMLGDSALQSDLGYEIEESLTTEVGARMVGTPGDAAAVSWAVAKMKALGFDKVWTEEVSHYYWQRGSIEARIVAPYPHKLVALALGDSVATPAEGITAEVVQFDDFAALRAAPADSLTGKIAYISHKMTRAIDGSGYGPAVAARSAGADVSSSKGAVAFILRSIGTDNNRTAHTGGLNYRGNATPIPAAALSNPDADLLDNVLKRGKPVHFYLNLASRSHEDTVIKTANVIGEVTGDGSADDFIILGAHLDSWDVGTGAIDDGLGISTVLAAAANIARLETRPKRTIRVVLFAAEEVGLIGVRQYLEDHINELDKHAIGAEWDMGTDFIYKMEPGVGPESLAVMREISTVLAPYGVAMAPTNNAKGDSDMSILGNAGMPAVELNADSNRYFDLHHTENDTLDKVNPEALKQAIAVYTIFAYLTADSGVNFRK